MYNNLKFFDKIFVRRRFRNAPMGKNLVDGEILCLGMISEYLYMLFYAGEIQNSNYRRLEMATYFFKRVRFARADKAVALQYHNQ